MEKQACKNCRFWLKEGEAGNGWCRAKPPQVFLVMGQDTLGRPAMNFQGAQAPARADGWCGEYAYLEPAETVQ